MSGEKVKQKQIARLTDLKRVFGTPEGKRVLHGLMVEAGFLTPSFSADPYVNAHQSGKRDLVAQLVHNLKMKPEVIERHFEAYQSDMEESFQ